MKRSILLSLLKRRRGEVSGLSRWGESESLLYLFKQDRYSIKIKKPFGIFGGLFCDL